MDREESILDREALKNEISAKVRNELSTENSSESKKYYMAGTIGMTDYSATNVQSKMGAGFSMGTDVSERLAFEAMFFYSRHLIDEEYWRNGLNIYQEMDQYNFWCPGQVHNL